MISKKLGEAFLSNFWSTEPHLYVRFGRNLKTISQQVCDRGTLQVMKSWHREFILKMSKYNDHTLVNIKFCRLQIYFEHKLPPLLKVIIIRTQYYLQNIITFRDHLHITSSKINNSKTPSHLCHNPSS